MNRKRQKALIETSLNSELADAYEKVKRAHIDPEELCRQLEDVQRKLHFLLDGIRDYAVILMDANARVIGWNAGARDMLGYDESSMFGQPLDRFFTPEDRKVGAPAEELRRAREEGRSSDDRWHLRKDGERVWVSGYVRPVFEPGGILQGYVKVMRELTQTKIAERELQVSEARARLTEEWLRLAAEGGQIGFWDYNPRTAEATWDAGLRRLYGMSTQEPAAMERFWAMVHPDDREALRKIRETSTNPQGSGAFSAEYRLIRPDGQLRWLHSRGMTLFEGEGPQRAAVRQVGVAEDVTERKRAEQSLQESQRTLAELNRELEKRVEQRTAELRRKDEELARAQKLEAVGRLAGGVAHDFNNLLTGILGIAQELVQSLPEGDSRRQDAAEIVNAANRAFGVTKQLLAFGRRKVIQPRVLNVNDVVTEYQTLLTRLIGEDVRLVVELQATHTVRMDAASLGQVVMNLAINARDAMPHGGTLTLRTADVTLKGHEPERRLSAKAGDYVLLEVADTGQGMDRETLGRIFEPFFTTKEPGKGTGLGLATIYGVVEQIGGDIRVESSPGQGSSFKVYFPVTADEPGAAPAAPSPGDAQKGIEAVLVVEDDDLVRRLIVRRLAKLGYRVVEAPNGERALELMAAHGRDVRLVITDVVMPEMNGRQLVEELRRTHPDIKALFMSGYPEDIITTHGILAPGIFYLDKSELSAQLPQKVRDALEGSTS